MPHLQDESEEKFRQDKLPGDAIGSISKDLDSNSELPIQEAREGYLGLSDPVVSALASKVSAAASNKVESFESMEANSRSPTASRPIKPVITPSSVSSNARLTSLPRTAPSKNGPILTLFGDKSISSSPIRVKRRVSQSEEEEDDEDDHIVMSQPSHLRLGSPTAVTHTGKRCVSSDQDNYSDNNSSGAEGSPRKVQKKMKMDQSSRTSEVTKVNGVPKKRTISPTSSGEKGEDDDHTEASGPPYLHYNPYEKSFHGQPTAHYHPHPPAFAFGGIPPYGAGYPMYPGYPAHRLPYASPLAMGHIHGHPGAPGFFPSYPHAVHMMHQPRHLYPPFSPRHRMSEAMPPKRGTGAVETSLDSKGIDRGNTKKESLKSGADWQQSTMSAGNSPSANRCVPLKEPLPSKSWGEGDKTKDAILPDFHRLVNYPDYLTKSRNGSSDISSSSSGCCDGKKNCVMCGKLRICSATSLINKGRAMNDDEFINAVDQDGDSAHIIPRQNKGLCTACDVTVWMVIEDGLEIKWCKGCKNFRPWAAFGDKGGATKCVRCRDRQREKYALQKDVVKPRKFKLSGSNSSFTSSSSDEKEEENNLVDAARGLRNLMNAAAATAV